MSDQVWQKVNSVYLLEHTNFIMQCYQTESACYEDMMTMQI